VTAFLLALCLATAEVPQAEVRPRAVRNDPRSRRGWVISGEAGWNSLVGVGAVVARHLDPHLTVEAGVGLSAEGPKFGARVRYNFLVGEWTPFFGAGFLYGTGLQGARVDSTSPHVFTYTVGPSPFLQLAAGLEYQSRTGLNFLAAAGYARLLQRNLTVISGSPTDDDLQPLRLLTGGGLVASASLGFAF
jgi:hypothetical protein